VYPLKIVAVSAGSLSPRDEIDIVDETEAVYSDITRVAYVQQLGVIE